MVTKRSSDAAMTPMGTTVLWQSSAATPIKEDPDTAILVIRLELAINALAIQQESAAQIAGMPENSAARVRSSFWALLMYASFVKEAANILTGNRAAKGQLQRVVELARAGEVAPGVVKKVKAICGGRHPACALLERMRNKIGFHWDPAIIREALFEFSNNESVIWIEAPQIPSEQVVHRLAIDVAGAALFPPANPAPTTDKENAHFERRISRALEHVADAGHQIFILFNKAVIGYLTLIKAERHTRERDGERNETADGAS